MLTALLEQIPSAFSRRFILGSFFPLLLFWVGSVLVASTFSPTVRAFATDFAKSSALEQAFLTVAATLILATFALVLSALRTLGRQALERSWLPKPLRELRQSEREPKLKFLENMIEQARLSLRALRTLNARGSDELTSARLAGTRDHKGQCNYPTVNPIHEAISKNPRSIEDLKKCLDGLVGILAANDVDTISEDGTRLNEDHVKLIRLIRAQVHVFQRRYSELEQERAEKYPGGRTYDTRFGAIAGFIRAYITEHYGADHDVVWPRLETVLRKERPEILASMEEAGTQVDFYIWMYWLTGLFFVGWTLILGCIGFNPLLVLLIAVGGPALCAAWYELGARSYQALSEQLCTAFDVARLKVFSALGLELPKSARDELKYWDRLSSVLAFGGPVELPYANRGADPTSDASGNT